jgi:hypothetical protein
MGVDIDPRTRKIATQSHDQDGYACRHSRDNGVNFGCQDMAGAWRQAQKKERDGGF